MRVRIVALSAPWPTGAVVEMDDRRAQRFIDRGYAEPVKDTPKAKGKEK